MSVGARQKQAKRINRRAGATLGLQPPANDAQHRLPPQHHEQRVAVPPGMPLESDVATVHDDILVAVTRLIDISRGNPRMASAYQLRNIDVCKSSVEGLRAHRAPYAQDAISILIDRIRRIIL
jgi:hypothetical protein